METYTVKWIEEHEATVDAEDEEIARDYAIEYSQSHGTLAKCFDFRTEKEEE